MGRVLQYSVLMCLVTVLITPLATAHNPNIWHALLSENGITSGSVTNGEITVVQNDSIVWHNIENSSLNITHRIVFDADGDGHYNSTKDWDSGLINSTCQDSEGNTSYENCRLTFIVRFNTTSSVGVYNYQDIRSDGQIFNGTIIVERDFHGQLDTDYCFGEDCDDKVDTVLKEQSILSKLIGSDSTLDALLFVMSLITGLLAIILAIDIFRNKKTHS